MQLRGGEVKRIERQDRTVEPLGHDLLPVLTPLHNSAKTAAGTLHRQRTLAGDALKAAGTLLLGIHLPQGGHEERLSMTFASRVIAATYCRRPGGWRGAPVASSICESCARRQTRIHDGRPVAARPQLNWWWRPRRHGFLRSVCCFSLEGHAVFTGPRARARRSRVHVPHRASSSCSDERRHSRRSPRLSEAGSLETRRAHGALFGSHGPAASAAETAAFLHVHFLVVACITALTAVILIQQHVARRPARTLANRGSVARPLLELHFLAPLPTADAPPTWGNCGSLAPSCWCRPVPRCGPCRGPCTSPSGCCRGLVDGGSDGAAAANAIETAAAAAIAARSGRRWRAQR